MPRAPNHWGDAEKSQECRKYFLQCHRCRSKQISGVRIIFAPISSNLPEKLLCYFCQRRRSSFVFLQRWAPFLPGFSGILLKFSAILPKFSGILPGFSTNQNFWGCACTTVQCSTLLPKGVRFEHGGAKLVSCPGTPLRTRQGQEGRSPH